MADKRSTFRHYQFHRLKDRPFRNPNVEPQKKRISWRAIGISIGVVAVICSLIYLFGFAPFWMITDVRVQGLQFMGGDDIIKMADDELDQHRLVIFPERNTFFFDQKALTDALNAKYAFSSLSLDISRHILTITVKERVSQIIWKTGSSYLYVDDHGTVIRSLPDADVAFMPWHGSNQPLQKDQPIEGPYPELNFLNTLPLIIDGSAAPEVPGAHVMGQGNVEAVIAFNEAVAQQGVVVATYMVERTDNVWVRAQMKDGYDVLFDTTMDVPSQVAHLMDILNHDVTDKSKLGYVDVRFGDHVYYKNK